MKNSVKDFFRSSGSQTEEDLQKGLARLLPSVEAKERKARRLAVQSFRPTWGWLTLSGVAALGVACIVILRGSSHPIEPSTAPVIATAISPPTGNPSNIVPVPEPTAATVAARPYKKKPALPLRQTDTGERVAVDFLRKMDMIRLLPILTDLDILQRWSGKLMSSNALPWLNFFMPDLVRNCFAEEIPLNDQFLDQLIRILPKLPSEEQAAIVDALERLKPIWEKEKKELMSNYRAYRERPPQAQALVQERFALWQKLSPETQASIRSKYDVWKKLSPKERAKLRKQVLSG